MSAVSILSDAVGIDTVADSFTDDQVKNEPMLFNNDLEHARLQGGPITSEFLRRLPLDWRDVPLVIDSRVHMLMPGWYPCIPGWHHDDVPRARADNQPEYEAPTDRAEHILMLINADLAPTEFAVAPTPQEFEVPPLGRTIYEDWHPEVERKIESGQLQRIKVSDRVLVQFNDRTWHRGTPAVGTGWRFFIRASRYYNKLGEPIARRNPRTNEIRKQVQVYMSAENAGW